MKKQLSRLLAVLCLLATLATAIALTASAADVIGLSYGKIGCGPETAYNLKDPFPGDRLSFYEGAIYTIPKGAYAPLEEGTYSLLELFGKEGAYADIENQVTFYDTYFKQFETANFANGLDNKEASGYAEAFESAITKLTSLYSKVALLGSTMAEFEYCNANPNYKTFKTYDFAKEGNGFWINFDYYYTPDYKALGDVGNFQFRFNKKGAIIFKNGEHAMIPYTTLEGDTVAFTEEGWNRVSLFFHQTTTVTGSAGSYTGTDSMTVTVYINGVEKTVWNATKTGMSSHPLYTSTVDPETGAVTATPKSWGDYPMSLYCTAIRSGRNAYRVSRFGAASVSTGTKADLTVKPISYELAEGMALPTEQVNPADEQYLPAKNYFFIPNQTNGVTEMTFLTEEAKNYYDTTKSLVLPKLDTEAGYQWVDSEGNAVTDVASMPADGKVRAVVIEGDYTVTASNKGEVQTSKPYGNVYTLSDDAAYWLVNGEIKAAGETIELTADLSVYALAVELLDGASARAGEASGLRFETVVDSALLSALAEVDYEIGTLILPTDLLGSTEFTAEALTAAGSQFLKLTSKDEGVYLTIAENGDATFYAAIVNILSQNYARKFSAVSYIKVGETVVYTDYDAENNSRSVYEVAVAANKAEPDASYADVIRGFINGVIVIENGAQVQPDGYTHPYVAEVVAGMLMISHDTELLDKDDIKTVIIDGEIYTGGWTADGGVITAMLPANE